MAESVARAIREQRHLVVQAGTGTGKSLAYLVPALVLGTRAVVSTATKALQDQLAARDLPHLAGTLGVPFEFAVLKGRSNYICRQRVAEVASGDQQLGSTSTRSRRRPSPPNSARSAGRFAGWSSGRPGRHRGPGRAGVGAQPGRLVAAERRVAGVPGRGPLPLGRHLLRGGGAAPGPPRPTWSWSTPTSTRPRWPAGGELLPPHDLVVFDEAHELEDIASAALGFEIGAGRFQALARTARPLLDDYSAADRRRGGGRSAQSRPSSPHRGALLPRPLDDATRERPDGRPRAGAAAAGGYPPNGASPRRGRPDRARADRRRSRRPEPGFAPARPVVQQAAGHLLGDLDQVLELPEARWPGWRGPTTPRCCKVAPLDVGAALQAAPLGPRGCPHRGDDQRHHPPSARRATRSGAGLLRRARRRQPLRL